MCTVSGGVKARRGGSVRGSRGPTVATQKVNDGYEVKG